MTATLVASACGGGTASEAPADGGSASAAPTAAPAGGTITMLILAEQALHIDPQRVYTGEDVALFQATLYRTLTAFKISADPVEGTSLTPDLATDTGTAADGGKTWSFTIRDGATFEDGSPVTCADVAYGVSRTFATDIITDGPQYAVSMLDIPTADDGSSAYKGPYVGTGQELFDKAVTCSADGKTITFHLSRPIPDFNYTVTLPAFSPVPKAKDTGEKYDATVVSSGPYKISEYSPGKGGKLVLVRNENWKKESDPYRLALPDSWVVNFGIDQKVIDQRMIQNTGEDETALSISIEPEQLAVVFTSATEPNPEFATRAVSALDPFLRYLAINTKKITDVNVRTAIAVAVDREAYRKVRGGDFAGEFADGLIKSNEGLDYAPTGMWETLLGKQIPPTGDPEYAKQLLAEAGATGLTIRYDYAKSNTGDKVAAVLVESLARAGITVKPNPIEPGQYYGVVLDPEKAGDLMVAGWAPDWPNASTIIPELLTPAGGFNLSQYDNPEFSANVEAAKVELDRQKQAKLWQELNTAAMKDVAAIPLLAGLTQRLAGKRVGPVFLWPAWGSWPYPLMSVTQ